jgi:hypothetical protein
VVILMTGSLLKKFLWWIEGSGKAVISLLSLVSLLSGHLLRESVDWSGCLGHSGSVGSRCNAAE